SFAAISPLQWILSALSALAAYAALAGYDRLALMHLRRRLPWLFVTIASFTTYALSHNLGASVFSGAVVRYRAYTSKGLNAHEVGLLVAFCSFTFALGTILATGFVFVTAPEITERFVDILPVEASATTGLLLLCIVAVYVVGSWLELRPLRFGKFELQYPRLR